jgi:lipoprotein-releasing system ATP-binding protein
MQPAVPLSNSGNSDDMCTLSARGLTKRFQSGDRELVVFENLDIDVRRGERVALTGESGAGKSTLLYLLGGLDRPSGGKIYFGQKDLSQLSDQQLAEYRNRYVGFVWQNHSLLPEFTAIENVMMPLLIRGAEPEEAQHAAHARLDEVGLQNRASHRAGELSGGEQQRVALARALAGSPEILLADEPTGNLDAKTGEMVMSLLEQAQHLHNLTLLYVTHNSAFSERADRRLHFEKGQASPTWKTSDRADSQASLKASPQGGSTHHV